MNWAVFERERPWSDQGTISAFPGGNEETHDSASFGVPTEIRTHHFSNTIQEHYCYTAFSQWPS
jgi:hypothetical protein